LDIIGKYEQKKPGTKHKNHVWIMIWDLFFEYDKSNLDMNAGTLVKNSWADSKLWYEKSNPVEKFLDRSKIIFENSWGQSEWKVPHTCFFIHGLKNIIYVRFTERETQPCIFFYKSLTLMNYLFDLSIIRQIWLDIYAIWLWE